MREIGGLLAGVAAAVVAIMLTGFVGGLFFTIEAPTDAMAGDAVVAALGAAPVGTQVTLVLSWFIGGFAALAAAKKVAGVSWPGWIVAGLLALLLAGTFLVPLPVWMQILAVLGPLIGALGADVIVRGRAMDPVGEP